MECCEESLWRDLYHSNSYITTEPEVVILMMLWHLAVRDENMLSQAILQNMYQDRDEGIRNFTAKLHGQADICKFTISYPYGCNTHFMEQMARDAVIHDLEDPEIWQRVWLLLCFFHNSLKLLPVSYHSTRIHYIAKWIFQVIWWNQLQLPQQTMFIDDTCMWADSLKNSFFWACRCLDLCNHNGIIVNPEKF